MPTLGTIADAAARVYCRLSGLSSASRWSVRVLSNALETTYRVRDGDREYRFLASSPLLLWRAKTLFSKEPETVSWLRQFGAHDVFYDVGANVGSYTVLAASRGARVFAFEPESSNFAVLNRNIALNGLERLATAYPFAVAEATRLDTLRLSRLEAGAALHAFGGSVDFKGEAFQPVFHQGALALPLDELVHRLGLPQPTQIKVDVDGLEAQVIAGAAQVTEDRRLKGVLIEINEGSAADREIVALLGTRGFRVAVQGEVTRIGTATMRNLILKRDG
jgi:FkbM family methyltransferase